MAELAIGDEAIELVEGAMTIRPHSHRLDGVADTTRAGFRIQNLRQSQQGIPGCTMGPWARLTQSPGAYIFVTASHCSQVAMSNPDGFSEWQPAYSSTSTARRIGYEFADMPYFYCSLFEPCRYADAAYFLMQGTIPRAFGIANPATGSLNINHTKPMMHIGAMRANAMFELGDSVQMIGSKTGRQGGVITHVCQDSPTSVIDANGLTGTMKCQMVADYSSDGGDSGAPIHGDGLVLLGIHTGETGVPGDPQELSVFSPIENIVNELGSIDPCSRYLLGNPCAEWLW
jgi:hypothetical protein